METKLDFLAGHSLVVYSSDWCPDCKRLKELFAERDVSYEHITIDMEPRAAERLERETGKRAVPYILVDGKKWVRGYHAGEPGRLQEALLWEELGKAVAE